MRSTRYIANGDITKVVSADTFLRPIYAGNAFATVKSKDAKKCITVRPTFNPVKVPVDQQIEKTDPGEEFGHTKFIKEKIKSIDQNFELQEF